MSACAVWATSPYVLIAQTDTREMFAYLSCSEDDATGTACFCFIRLADELTRSDNVYSLSQSLNAKARKARKCRFRDVTTFRLRIPSERVDFISKNMHSKQKIACKRKLRNAASGIANWLSQTSCNSHRKHKA